jgi:nitroimidazol reductase NimA-like FMN-containing flavoprotein (pyridoxamine 5'-phosphate oxidase superfamily)
MLVDEKASLFGRIPWAMLIIALSTFVLLFLMFGSVLVPVKALVLNVLSLSATFGAMVWIFQDGHLSNTLDFTAIGALDTTTPILMFCIAFGLSMDYEVFLLSRIKEEWDSSGDNVRSVAVGLEHTGRIVTAAAALLAVVFLAFATSRITFIKLFGIGLTMAVVMDATVIRATLVPAFMRLAGRANWWAPRPLRRVYERWGIHEHVDLDGSATSMEGRTKVRRKAERGRYDDATIRSILDEAMVCHVGFAVDGRPWVVPTAFAVIGDALYLHGATGNFALRTLAGGVEACVTVTLVDGLVLSRSAFHHSLNYRSVMVFGFAEPVTDPAEKLAVMHALVEHLVPGRSADTRPPTDGELRQTLVVRLPLTEASAKVRTGPPVEDDADLTLGHWAGELPLSLVAGAPVPDPFTSGAAPGYLEAWSRQP